MLLQGVEAGYNGEHVNILSAGGGTRSAHG